jgi:hypothetical protein
MTGKGTLLRGGRIATSAMLVCVLSVGLAAGCGGPSMPRVPEEVVDRLAGDQVTVLAQVRDTNPTSEFLYTYAMLEVAGDPPYTDTIAATLTMNGWQEVEEPALETDVVLRAKLPSEADVHLVELAGYLESPESLRSEEEFEQI